MCRFNRWFFILGGILLAVLIGASLFGGYGGWGGMGGWGFGWPMMRGGYYGGGFGSEWFMPVISIIFIGLAIVAVIALLRSFSRNSRIQPVSGQANAALEILNRRYAQGEIDKKEYEEKKKDLL
jgi:putative membrane protein